MFNIMPTKIDYSSKTVKELLTIVKEKGLYVSHPSKATKAALISAIQNKTKPSKAKAVTAPKFAQNKGEY
jgi:hypothetical protein